MLPSLPVATGTPMISAISTASPKPTVVFTTPSSYAGRLTELLFLRGLDPLWCPSITTRPTPHNLSPHLSPASLSHLSAIAFPSRTSVAALSLVIRSLPKPLLPPGCGSFSLAALGRDSELIDGEFVSNFSSDSGRVKVLVPLTATPTALVRALGEGHHRKILCPVPRVVGLTEPPVVPEFLRDLELGGWVPVRVDAYETTWVGNRCAERLLGSREVNAVLFTSTAEVEGLLKSLRELRWDWGMVRERWKRMVVAAHGPVTAAGAERLGVGVDVVGSRFGSFDGVVDELVVRLEKDKLLSPPGVRLKS